jgi:TonB-dependent receptor
MLRCFLPITLACLLMSTGALFAAGGVIEGHVRDSQSGEPLPGANVMIVKTSLGSSTDVEGRFIIRDVMPGSYTLRATYVGYRQKEITVQIKDGQTLKQDFKLVSVGVEGEEVVVTAQAQGQKEAINQQLASMPVMNVVSAARIQELPDVNAAESVGRLPGVSLIRTGGEGSKVVIRGLSPQYNQITIDGVELSSNVNSMNNIGSSDPNTANAAASLLGDRGMDLSMISSSQLGGIEVIKAITPDMDASVLGGVVNFDMRKAAKEPVSAEGTVSSSWLPHLEIGSQAGYNRLRDTYKNYRFVGSVEKRFMDNSLGIFLQGTAEKRNLSANALAASYNLVDKSHGDLGIPDLTSVSGTDVNRTRERIGGTFVIDYQHETGEIGFMNSFNKSDTRSLSNTENYGWQSDVLYFTVDEQYNELTTLTNILRIKQDIPFFRMTLKASHAYSESNNPEDPAYTFRDLSGVGYQNKGDLSKATPKAIMDMAQANLFITNLHGVRIAHTVTKERTLNGALDLENNFTLSEMVTGSLKFGGAALYRTRDYDIDVSTGSGYDPTASYVTQAFPWLSNGVRLDLVNIIPFVDGSYNGNNFLKGEYPHPYWLKSDYMWLSIPFFKMVAPLGENNPRNKLENTFNDYGGNETRTAAYAMLTVNVGEDLKILPGVRYQNLSTTYHAMRGMEVPGGIQGGDTTVTQTHGYWLPMVHLRYSPLDWVTVHAAYTNTLNYPDYSTLIPRYYVSPGYIYYNNYRIKPARSENYDLVVSLHSNEIGLLTFDGFKKRITDLMFYSRTYRSGKQLGEFPDLPQGSSQLYEVNTYINNKIPIDLYGLETEWQTNFWYLPKPLDGLVLTINYTHIFSEASYPRSVVNTDYDDEGNMTQTVTDTSYTTRLLNQPNDILNLSFGYDYKGFSARLSMLYQDNIFKQPDFWMQNRINSQAATRWDLAVKQELPWFGMQIFLSLNNITGVVETDVNQRTLLPANEEYYGMSGDLGLRIKI